MFPILLQQTLTGCWLIARQDPVNPNRQTQMAEFNTHTVNPSTKMCILIEKNAAAAFTRFVKDLNIDPEYTLIKASSQEALERMTGFCIAEGLPKPR
jgi:hypothetical protein